MDNNTQPPKTDKPPITPPAIEPQLLLKWGLALLGEEKAKEYLAWLLSRLGGDSRSESHVLDS